MYGRWLEPPLRRKLASPYVHILFGARQTGKTTLLRKLIPDASLWIDLSDPAQRSDYLRNPGVLIAQCRALPRSEKPPRVVIDEVQAVPPLFDAVQHLFDLDHERWRFVLCGSSARKLRVTGANLLPGRSILHRVFPLILPERPPPKTEAPPRPIAGPLAMDAAAHQPPNPRFPATSLIERLTFGELPGLALAPVELRHDLLRTYSQVYLEEELRREALIKDWAAFARFLQLAAQESGQMLNYAAVSREAGVSLPTVKNYYQLLEDMFIGFRVSAFSGSKRKNLLSTERYYFFDLGVRHAAAGLEPVPAMVQANPGLVFEQWVGIELWKRLQYLGTGKLTYLRTKGGLEIDFIIDLGNRLIPIEAKWTENPTYRDARHLVSFLEEHGKRADAGFVICRCRHPMVIGAGVTALPWSAL